MFLFEWGEGVKSAGRDTFRWRDQVICEKHARQVTLGERFSDGMCIGYNQPLNPGSAILLHLEIDGEYDYLSVRR